MAEQVLFAIFDPAFDQTIEFEGNKSGSGS
jgi:hypothetical protein